MVFGEQSWESLWKVHRLGSSSKDSSDARLVAKKSGWAASSAIHIWRSLLYLRNKQIFKRFAHFLLHR